MKNKKIGFALLGCGRIAQKHAELICNHVEEAELVAVCDVIPERAQKFATKYHTKAYSSLKEMIAGSDRDIDVVSVLTPSGYHARNVVDIVQYKKHVVVEKPMALTLDDAEVMIHACDAAGVRLFVVKQNRYNYPVTKLKEAVDAGRFGRIVMGSARVRWCRDQSYYDQDDWRGSWLLDGGVMSNQAAHHIDLLNWLVGDVVSVFAYTSRQLVDIEAEDTGVALIKYANGAIGTIEATTAARPKDLEASISILGESGSAEISGFAVNEMRTWQFVEELDTDKEVLEKYRENPPNVYGFGHLEYLKHVVHAMQNEGAAMVDGLEGLKSLRIINAIYESAESGREVNLRFSPKFARLGQRKRRRRTDPPVDENFFL